MWKYEIEFHRELMIKIYKISTKIFSIHGNLSTEVWALLWNYLKLPESVNISDYRHCCTPSTFGELIVEIPAHQTIKLIPMSCVKHWEFLLHSKSEWMKRNKNKQSLSQQHNIFRGNLQLYSLATIQLALVCANWFTHNGSTIRSKYLCT